MSPEIRKHHSIPALFVALAAMALLGTACTVAPYDGALFNGTRVDFRGGAMTSNSTITIQVHTSQGWETVGQTTSTRTLLAAANSFGNNPAFYKWEALSVNPFNTNADGFRPTARVRVLHAGLGRPIPAFHNGNEILCMFNSSLNYVGSYQACTNGGIDEIEIHTNWRPAPGSPSACGDNVYDPDTEICDASDPDYVEEGGYCTDTCTFVGW
jgi:hypothetical protein